MNFDLHSLLEQILKAPARTRVVALLSIVAVAAALGIGGWLSGQPHFVKLYSDLPDAERVAVEKALAGANIRYRISDFPGPFVVYVDDGQYDQAQIAVALDEALKQAPRGIDSDASGAASIFKSAGERAQTMQKRDWQEAERLLEHLDFVTDATVTTSMPDPSPLRASKPVMVSVALELRGAPLLSPEQASNVAKLVRYRFDVPAENVVITDQSGRTLYDPALLDDRGADVDDLLQKSSKYDRELARKANEQIESAYGTRKALVTVTSQWNYDQTTVVDEKIDPETVATQIDTKTTQTPSGAANDVGGAAGFGNENAPVPQAVGGAAGALATTKDEKKVFDASRMRTQTVRTTPKLERLFVSLVLDESLAAKKDELQKVVEAAVGFDKTRQDSIGVSVTSFVAAPEASAPATSEGADAAPQDEGPSPMTEMLLQRGVEIVSALGFLFLLITSLKGGKHAAGPAKRAPSGPAGALHLADGGENDVSEAALDPEALARAQIEELVRSDPRRVGEILSRWVDEKSTAKV